MYEYVTLTEQQMKATEKIQKFIKKYINTASRSIECTAAYHGDTLEQMPLPQGTHVNCSFAIVDITNLYICTDLHTYTYTHIYDSACVPLVAYQVATLAVIVVASVVGFHSIVCLFVYACVPSSTSSAHPKTKPSHTLVRKARPLQ